MRNVLHRFSTKDILRRIQLTMEEKVELTMSQWRAIEKMQDLIFDLQTTVERMSHSAAEQAAAEKLSRRYQKILDQVHPERQEWRKNDTLDI